MSVLSVEVKPLLTPRSARVFEPVCLAHPVDGNPLIDFLVHNAAILKLVHAVCIRTERDDCKHLVNLTATVLKCVFKRDAPLTDVVIQEDPTRTPTIQNRVEPDVLFHAVTYRTHTLVLFVAVCRTQSPRPCLRTTSQNDCSRTGGSCGHSQCTPCH